MRARWAVWLGTVVVVAALPGCRSVRGRYVDPQAVRHGEDVGGAPVVVERPRYLKVTFKKTTRAVSALETLTTTGEPALPSADDGGTPPKATTADRATATVRELGKHEVDEIETEVVSVGEVYAIDLMRPFSGTADHSLEMMDASGHLKSLHAKVDDQTFKDVLTNLPDIQSFIKGFSAKTETTRAAEATSKADVKAVPIGTRVVQIQIFDLQDVARGVYRPVMVLPSPGGLCTPPCPTAPACPVPPGPCAPVVPSAR